MKSYSKDTTAEAVVIYDIGQTDFRFTDDGYVMVFERTFKIKIFKKIRIRMGKYRNSIL